MISYVRKADHNAIKGDLQQIHHASSLKEAEKALGRFCERWKGQYPLPKIRTTNAIERRFRETRTRTRPMGVFSDHTYMERSYTRYPHTKT